MKILISDQQLCNQQYLFVMQAAVFRILNYMHDILRSECGNWKLPRRRTNAGIKILSVGDGIHLHTWHGRQNRFLFHGGLEFSHIEVKHIMREQIRKRISIGRKKVRGEIKISSDRNSAASVTSEVMLGNTLLQVFLIQCLL